METQEGWQEEEEGEQESTFSFETPATPGTGADRPASGVTMVLRNNRLRAWPGHPLRTIETTHTLARGNAQPNDRYDIFVFDYQGQAGNDFFVCTSIRRRHRVSTAE